MPSDTTRLHYHLNSSEMCPPCLTVELVWPSHPDCWAVWHLGTWVGEACFKAHQENKQNQSRPSAQSLLRPGLGWGVQTPGRLPRTPRRPCTGIPRRALRDQAHTPVQSSNWPPASTVTPRRANADLSKRVTDQKNRNTKKQPQIQGRWFYFVPSLAKRSWKY